VKETVLRINGRNYRRYEDGTWMMHVAYGNWTEVASWVAVDALNEVVRLKENK
jgi:hypothetical protein